MMKILKITGIILLAIIIITFCYFFIGIAKPVAQTDFGVTFSKIYAKDLGLDWQETYLAILDDLKVKQIRLIAYWTEIEPTENNFDFKDLDWQINEATKRGAEIILAVGRRLPRWPECHIPEWAKDLPEDKQQEKVLAVISKTVNRYKDRESIKLWQVENEPFLDGFGNCPKLDKEFLDKEIELVESLSPKSVLITESGEFSTWIGGSRRTNIIGTSLYRVIWARYLKMYIRYPLPAIFYQRKTALVKKLFKVEDVILIELQGEPWGSKPIQELSTIEAGRTMDTEKFDQIINYTKRAGFSEAYLWGVEWWYWLKDKHNDDRFWETAKSLF